MYSFIEAEKAEQGNVVVTCELFKVSRSAYYEWEKRDASRRELGDADLGTQIHRIHKRSRQTYGAPRVHWALRQQGERCSRKRVARLMRQLGWWGATPSAGRRRPSPILGRERPRSI